MASIVSGVTKKSTWKDAGAGVTAGMIQSVSSMIAGGVLGSILTSVVVGAMPSGKFVFDEMNKTAIIVNTMQDATNALLVG